MTVFSASDPVTVLSFLTALLSRISTEESPEAHVLLLSSLAHAKLLYGDLEGTRADMDAAWKILDDLDGVDTAVNAAYYSVAADYYKVRFLTCMLLGGELKAGIGEGRLWTILQELPPLPRLHRPC